MDSRLFEAIQLLRAVVGGNPDVGAIREFLAGLEVYVSEHVRNKLDPYVCEICGGDGIEAGRWVGANTNTPTGDEASGDFRCQRCEANAMDVVVTRIVRRSEFEKERLNPSR